MNNHGDFDDDFDDFDDDDFEEVSQADRWVSAAVGLGLLASIIYLLANKGLDEVPEVKIALVCIGLVGIAGAASVYALQRRVADMQPPLHFDDAPDNHPGDNTPPGSPKLKRP